MVAEMAARPRRAWQTRITRGALYLLIAEAAVSLVFLMLHDEQKVEMASWLVATTDSVWRQGKIWTLVTSPLLAPEFIILLFHGLILWLFVPVLERWWGFKRFLLFALYTSLAGTVAATLAGFVLPGPGGVSGLDPFIYASIVAFGVLYGDQKVQFFGVLPMTGRQLMIGMIVLASLVVLVGGRWSHGAAYAAAMGVAWLLTNGKHTPRLWWLRRKQNRVRHKLEVLRGGKDKGPWIN
jgi:membrane associated rhomboid family serine protease